MSRSPLEPLHRLSRLYRVAVSFWDAFGTWRQVSPETLLAVLRELGASVDSLADVPDAVRERRLAPWRQILEPVLLVWDDTAPSFVVRLPEGADGAVRCELALENGETHSWRTPLRDLPLRRQVEVEGQRFTARVLSPPVRRLPWGYHRLQVQVGGLAEEALVIAAPSRAYSLSEQKLHSWGVFLPLYALHSERSWGAGDFFDLGQLMEWAGDLGSAMVGTLPLLATFLDQPCDPSPYAPVSRQFWNEFYLDVRSIPELERSPKAKELAGAAAFQKEVAAFRADALVDHKPQMALRRRVLETLLETLLADSGQRREAFQHYVEQRPLLESYARFRAVVERRGTVWPEWPQRLREGTLTREDFAETARLYHLYVQWLADEQLARLSSGRHSLYLDFPLGVHRGGFDVWQEPESFALGAAGGAPPDPFFTRGQNWGFSPWHPERARRNGYRNLIASLRHHLRYASVLRIDHVMGLHRLYWVPQGFEATQGAYVGYHPEEHYAILSLESHRHEAAIVGEDLGTVPDRVRADMRRHGLMRMFVGQFEFDRDPARPLRPTPEDSLASLNTHDMRPFAGFWEAADVADQVELGLRSEEDAARERQLREAAKAALEQYLKDHSLLDRATSDPVAVARACLYELAQREEGLLLVNLEDLWGERLPQNTPGTVTERSNWRRRAAHPWERLIGLPEVVDTLRRINELRRQKQHPPTNPETAAS